MNIDKELILRKLKGYKNFGTDAAFAKYLGITPSVLSNWYKRNTFDDNTIVNKFPEVERIFILTGEGNMLKAENAPHNADSKDYSLVPLYNMDAMGGFGVNDEVDMAEYIQDHIPFKNAKQGDICVPVTGKSMLPTYYPGSIILLHEIECWREFLEMGQVYVIVLTDGRRLLKEIRHSLEDRKTHILCVSHNPEVQDGELPMNMIYKIFLVTALYQKTTM